MKALVSRSNGNGNGKVNGNGNGRVLDLVRKGEREPTIVALRTGISLQEAEQQVRELTAPKNPLDVLKFELQEACDMLQIAKDEYETDPTMYNSTSYTQILKEVQSLIEKIETFHDPSKTARDVVVVVQALTRSLMQATIEALRHLRMKVPSKAHPEIDSALRKFGHQVTMRYNNASDQIKTIMGADGDLGIHDINLDEIKRTVVVEQ